MCIAIVCDFGFLTRIHDQRSEKSGRNIILILEPVSTYVPPPFFIDPATHTPLLKRQKSPQSNGRPNRKTKLNGSTTLTDLDG